MLGKTKKKMQKEAGWAQNMGMGREGRGIKARNTQKGKNNEGEVV